MTKKDFNSFCLTVAHEVSYYSHAIRRKVGAVIAKDGNILAFGYNGTPHGFDNTCEDFICQKPPDRIIYDECTEEKCRVCNYCAMTTKENVVHAEENAIAKMAKSTASCEGASMYITCSPCARCARLIVQSGIKEVYYSEEYHSAEGINILQEGGVKTHYYLPTLKH